MIRGLVILGALVGVGWYAYRKVMGGGAEPVTGAGFAGPGNQPAAAGGIGERVTQSVSQAAAAARAAATTVVNKARAAAAVGGGAAADRPPPEPERALDGMPPEARAAAMAAMPAMQQPAPLPEV